MSHRPFDENFPYTNFHDLNLDWIIKTLKEQIESITKNSNSIDELNAKISEIEQWIDQFDDDLLRRTVKQLVNSYLESSLAEMIFVEINNEGYIVYYIPESWNEITFNTTGLDIVLTLQPEYGHLVLSY